MEGSKKKKVMVWKLLRNLLVTLAAIVGVFAMGSQGSPGGLETKYFQDMYRIDGVDYYLTSETFLWRFQWYELRREDENNTLVHRFPLWASPHWSEEEDAFFYRRGSWLYRWDMGSGRQTKVCRAEGGTMSILQKGHFLWWDDDKVPSVCQLDTGQVTVLEEVAGYNRCMVMEDYGLFYKHDDSPLVLVEWTTGQVVDFLELTTAQVGMQDAKGNQVLFLSDDSQTDVQLHLYDAKTRKLTLLNPQDDEQLYHIPQAMFALDGVVYAKRFKEASAGREQLAFYQVTSEGEVLRQWMMPEDQEIKTMAAGDDYVICVTESSSPDIESRQRVLTYYQLSPDGRVILHARWQPVDSHALNYCHVICDGDQVISGCVGEDGRIRFTVE